MLSLEDTCQTYHLNQSGERMATMLFDIVYEAIEKALTQRDELHRFQLPHELKDRDADFYTRHSVAGLMTALMEEPEALDILEWLEQDSVVQRHAARHPEILEQLARFKQMAEEARTLYIPLRAMALGSEKIIFQ